MLDEIVREHDVEAFVGIGDAAGIGDPTLVEHRVVYDTRVEIDTANPGTEPTEVHLLDDAGAGPQIEHTGARSDMREDTVAKQPVVPVCAVLGIEALVHPGGRAAHGVTRSQTRARSTAGSPP